MLFQKDDVNWVNWVNSPIESFFLFVLLGTNFRRPKTNRAWIQGAVSTEARSIMSSRCYTASLSSLLWRLLFCINIYCIFTIHDIQLNCSLVVFYSFSTKSNHALSNNSVIIITRSWNHFHNDLLTSYLLQKVVQDVEPFFASFNTILLSFIFLTLQRDAEICWGF